MEPLEIRSMPARMPLWFVVYASVLTAIGGWLLWKTVQVTALAAQRIPSDPERYAVCLVLLVILFLLLWVVLRSIATPVQLLFRYLFKDRGQQVVVMRIEPAGWRFLLGGGNVLAPWESVSSIEVVSRDDEFFTMDLRAPGRHARGRDPVSRTVSKRLRKPGFPVKCTLTDPTEDELADAVERLSAGRVTVTR